MKNYATGNSNPEAYITKGKQRVKQFNGIVYLNDGDNFEVEIFNPTSGHILAEISLNGKRISNTGLVLRPGERVFLERYIDTNNKFVYSTYEVNGNNEQVKRAIVHNGIVNVKFFREEEVVLNQTRVMTTYYPSTITIWPPIITTPTVYYTNTIGLHNDTFTCGNLKPSSFNEASNPVLGRNTSITQDSFFNMSSDMTFMDTSGSGELPKSFPPQDNSRKIETGTVEKGESSKQSFTTVNRNFQYGSFHNVEWHILPKSQKPITSKDLQQYCTKCGSKIVKSTFKYCPNCGNKLD